MKKRKILIATVIILTLSLAFYFIFFKDDKPEYSSVKVIRGDIVQEVSETGRVKMGEEINLSFKSSGRVEKIYVEVGEEVEADQSLAKLDTIHLSIQLAEAQAALEVAQAQLNKLLSGSTSEEIQVAKTSVLNAQSSLDDAKQNLEDVKSTAQEDLDAAYEDALNALDDAYLKAYNAFNKADLIERTYFSGSDQESITVQEKRNKIKDNLDQAKDDLDVAKNDSTNENIDTALTEFKSYLSNIYDALSVIRETTEDVSYRNTVSSVDKDSLDTHKTNINTALTNIINDQQIISSTKLTNEANINTAEAKVSSAEGDLKEAEDELALVEATPSQEDIDLRQAQVRQAQAQANLLQNQIQEATLQSPTEGQITETHKKVGEMANPAETVISLIPAAPFQVEVDIYEEDVVNVRVGNQVDITLVAFPDAVFKGRVISIDPAEKLIDGVVYYEVNIGFEKPSQEIKPGMTADIIIKTASRENVLLIPDEAIEKKDSKKVVQVIIGKTFEERKIEIGLTGSDDMVEVISGLREGEEIVIK